MKKLLFHQSTYESLLIALVALSCCCLHGTEPQPEMIQHHVTYWEHPHHIYLGPQAFLVNIDTKVGQVQVDDWNNLWGLDLGYEYLKPDDLYVGVDLMAALTWSVFSGKYQNYNISASCRNGWAELGFRLGYTLGIGREMISFFLGYGAIAFGHNQLGFHENMIVYSGGIRSQYEVSPFFNVGLNLQAIRTNRTNTEFRSSYFDLNYKNHHNLWGGEISIPFVWLVGGSRRWEIDLVPYFLKLDFSATQNIYGIQLLFGYRI